MREAVHHAVSNAALVAIPPVAKPVKHAVPNPINLDVPAELAARANPVVVRNKALGFRF